MMMEDGEVRDVKSLGVPVGLCAVGPGRGARMFSPAFNDKNRTAA